MAWQSLWTIMSFKYYNIVGNVFFGDIFLKTFFVVKTSFVVKMCVWVKACFDENMIFFVKT